MLKYYRPNNVTQDTGTVLISGKCPAVNAAYLESKLRQASANGYAAVIIDFCRTGDFSDILNCCNYHDQHFFTAGRDNYKIRDMSLRTAAAELRRYARLAGYDSSVCAQMTAFLNFLIKLELDAEKSSSVKQLLRKFSNQEKLENELIGLVRKKLLTRQEAQDHIQTYLEYAAGGLTADTLLSELEFMLNCGGDNSFSLTDLRRGEVAVLCADQINSNETNDYLCRTWTSDLISLSEHIPLFIAVNTGFHAQINRLYELFETFAERQDSDLFYSSYDLFSGISEEDARSFAAMFRYNVFGSHNGDSAQKISGMFPEQWVTQINYSDAQNRRILGESLIDMIFDTDHTVTVSSSMIKERIFPAQNISALSGREFIIFDTLLNTIRSSYV